jgi:hypothetical protein
MYWFGREQQQPFFVEDARVFDHADETMRTGWALMMSTVQLLSAFTEFAVVAVLLLFALQWHVLNRIHHLRDPRIAEAAADTSIMGGAKPR